MANGNGNTSSRTDRLGEILGAYFVAVEQGRAPSRQELLAQYPDLDGELAEYFAEQDRLDRMIAPMRSPGSPASTAVDDLTASFGSFPPVLLRDTDPVDGGDPLIQPLSPEMPALADRPTRLQLFGEIARGGMGAILRGRDVDLGRELAVKVLLESNQGHPEVVRRFIEEAQIGGQLQHPGIVPVYELGAFADRRPYFAMKLVKGQTLAELLATRHISGPLYKPEAPAKVFSEDPSLALQACEVRTADLPRFLSIFEQVCQTVAYAHARGVIHRDLKPSNVMVGAFGEVQVMDWGLAKVLPRGDAADRTPQDFHETDVMTVRSGSGADASRAGSILGTPSYMAPEQARGELDQVDERADVFGLGAILCEILTGKPPFGGETRDKVRENAAQGALAGTLHRLDASAADSELISLARDCLAADRQQRPRDAGIVSARITAYLSGVQDRLRKAELARVEAQAHAEEEQKRRRITVALAASVLLTAGVVGGGWAYLARQQQRRAAQVDLALREAEILRDDAERTGDDVPRWLAARDAAQAVERLVADARDAATRDRVTALLQQVTQAAKTAQDDHKLLDKLVDIRSAEADDPDGSESDAAYADAFREAGIDVDTLLPAEASARIKARPASVSLALSAAIDDWAFCRRKSRPKPEDAWIRLVAAARATDLDPGRDRLRDLWAQLDRKRQLEPLRKLAQEAAPETWPAQSLLLLANAMADAGDPNVAVALLRRAQARHPGDVWINFKLGFLMERSHPPQTQEAIRFYTVARALRPETALELALALESRGQGDEAAAVFRDLVRLRPEYGLYWAFYGRFLEDRGDRASADEALNRAVLALKKAIQLKPHFYDYNSLGIALQAQGKSAQAIAEFQEAIRLKSDAPNVHSNLGVALRDQGKLAEAIAEFREAIRLKPDESTAHSNLGNALREQGKPEEAIAEQREAIRLKSDNPTAYYNLGYALQQLGKLTEAIAEYREAIRLKPDYYDAHLNLGRALRVQGKLAEAVPEYQTCIRLKPGDAETHSTVGAALRDQGKPAEAIAECRLALRLEPGLASAHNNLATALSDLGKLAEAIAELREVVRLKPDYADAHSNLGTVLCAQGKPAEAITECREAIRLMPDHAGAHSNLGAALCAQGKLVEAIAEHRETIRLMPGDPRGYANLALVFRAQGEFAAAVVELRKARELAKADPGLVQTIDGELAVAESQAAIAARLPAVLRGEDQPKNATERLDFGLFCYNLKRFSASARLCAEAFQADPKLAEDMQAQHRYNAACASALAAASQGNDELPLDEPAKTRWRKQAIDWLKADLAFWTRQVAAGPQQARAAVVQILQHWKADTDLAGIREGTALAKLPQDEQKACRALWAEVEAVLKKAQAP